MTHLQGSYYISRLLLQTFSFSELLIITCIPHFPNRVSSEFDVNYISDLKWKWKKCNRHPFHFPFFLIDVLLFLQMQKWVVISWALLALVGADECPDRGMCKEGSTCCKQPGNGYGCCPLDQVEMVVLPAHLKIQFSCADTCQLSV